MLITELKDKETLTPLLQGKTVIIRCEGCKEVHFPEKEAADFTAELEAAGKVAVKVVSEYICNPEHLALQLEKHADQVKAADSVLVFSCGVGVQTAALKIEGKKVFAACDTYPLPGHQGVTPLEYDCDQCGECYLNSTGGICPITACSKSLVNGQCGGAKNGKCEVDSDMDCGWERIYRRLEKLGRLNTLQDPVKVRSFATELIAPESN